MFFYCFWGLGRDTRFGIAVFTCTVSARVRVCVFIEMELFAF